MNNESALQPNLPYETLAGILERITFQNDETGYTIARLRQPGQNGEITVVGNLLGMNVGESVNLHGLWTLHPQYGRQFEVRYFTIEAPTTLDGIRRYLGSGLIRGVGSSTAALIVNAFGLESLKVLDETPERLRELPGVGKKRAAQILAGWEEQRQIKAIMFFLQSQGVSASLAGKIYKAYGDAAIGIVRANPYQLMTDIYGIGFKTADQIARQTGVPTNSAQRIRAGLLYALDTLSNAGHCFALREQLTAETARLLDLEPALCQAQIQALLDRDELVQDGDALYLKSLYQAESRVAWQLARLAGTPADRLSNFASADWSAIDAAMDEYSSIHLSQEQKNAVRMALMQKVSIITGGPGTGKSTITRNIIELALAARLSVLLAAPTGRAAKRLSETTGLEARTIHRLLEYTPAAGNQFSRNAQNPLDADLIIVDEMSMVDIALMRHLVDAIGEGTHLVLVGDVDQLPSVGPGNVLRDCIHSGVLPVSRLTTIYRQADDSYIIVNAHHINQGEAPEFSKKSSDFFLFAEEDPKKAADWVIDLVSERIAKNFGFDANRDIQVLTPMHRGEAGVTELNQRLQATLNPPAARKIELKHGARVFREGDRVMQIHNDYDRQVFNGDIGQLQKIDLVGPTLSVNFDGRLVDYDQTQLDDLLHAYAISIHKAQGSEFPVVVIPILMQHYMMLQRNLLYTAVTRARKLVVLVGSRNAIATAVNNQRVRQRNTRLTERLTALFSSATR
ncbi:SF1B family DNA helicase RecD2 [Longilinea arvoryzae]|uniref:SF1B family DNA helicase RecD2 n=1 Tax=Longilinea arvoryzae TaxID=360412 RepID=UPI00094658E7|nr:ATP-dependent RecD-like DNA helicase [Longilinea arvoryzae]